METIELTREPFYEIVWSTQITKLTEKYAFSRDGIKALCKKYEIPIPENGYWSKVKFNKPIKRVKLNNVSGDEGKIILTIREEGNPINLDQTPLTILTKQIESDSKAPLIVPERLTKPDILIQNTKEIFNKRKKEPSYSGYIGSNCASNIGLNCATFERLSIN
ncbi:MAG: hypothetical protein ACOH1N_09855 [Lutibacter sp.]